MTYRRWLILWHRLRRWLLGEIVLTVALRWRENPQQREARRDAELAAVARN